MHNELTHINKNKTIQNYQGTKAQNFKPKTIKGSHKILAIFYEMFKGKWSDIPT